MFGDLRRRLYLGQLNARRLWWGRWGRDDRALPLATRALHRAQAWFGEQSAATAWCMQGLAEVYRGRGDLGQMERYATAATAVWHALGREEAPAAAPPAIILAGLYHERGAYTAAEPFYLRASAILRREWAHDPALADVLIGLARLYLDMHELDRPEPLLQEALAIRRRRYRDGTPPIAEVQLSLAAWRLAVGNVSTAGLLAKSALTTLRHSLPDRHPAVARALHLLANVYVTMGDEAAAAPLYREVEQIFRGVADQTTAAATAAAMLARASVAEPEVALPLYRDAIPRLQAALGEHHPMVAAAMHNLAVELRVIGDDNAAETILWQVLRVVVNGRTGVDPFGSLFAATCWETLAKIEHGRRNYGEAEAMLETALEARREQPGERQPGIAATLMHLAWIYAATGRGSAALTTMRQVADRDDRETEQIFAIASDRQRLVRSADIQAHVVPFLSLVLQQFSREREAVSAACDLVLRRKALAAEAAATQRDAVQTGAYPALRRDREKLRLIGDRLTRVVLTVPESVAPNEHARQVASLTAEKEALEAALAAQIPEMTLEQRLHRVDCTQVATALPSGAALVEFVKLDVFNFAGVPRPGGFGWLPDQYLAFVLHAGRPDEVALVDLGEVDTIDQLIADFRAAITGEEQPQGVARSLGTLPAAASVAADDVGSRLRAAVFDPLLPACGGATRLILAPDGDLTRLPFEVMPGATGGQLLDAYQISYVSTGRDVLRFGAVTGGGTAASLVIAAPDYELRDRSPARSRRHPFSTASRRAGPDGEAEYFAPLPHSAVEGEQVAAALGVRPWLGAAALEGRLKQCRSPRILHIAAHGFFYPDPPHHPESPVPDRGAGHDRLERVRAQGADQALLRSGLALAGANTWRRGGTPPEEAEDGVLTAADVSGLDLRGTELVVLSSCDTGLGSVRRGEGVFGLRRAFVLAGAKTVIMSLWKVPDESTQALMVQLYHHLLHGMSRAEALRAAQLAVRAHTPAPRCWGAFVCLGDPGPLSLPRIGDRARG